MNKKKIYIAGKVTGEDRQECTKKFSIAKQQIISLGLEAVNPLEVVGSWDISWENAMKKCIKSLMDCDGVYMLPDCGKSPGAKLETRLALEFKIPLYTHPDLIRMAIENAEI